MAGFVVVTYLVIGLVVGLAGLYLSALGGLRMADRPLDRVLALTLHLKRRGQVLTNLRWQFCRLILIPAEIVAWPNAALGLYFSFRSLTNRETAGRIALAPLILATSVTTFCFALLLVGLRLLGYAGWAIDLGCIALLVALLARFVSGTVAPVDLPAVIRRNLMHPYIQFAAAAALDYLSVLLAATLVERLRDGSPLTVAVLLEQVRDLTAFSHVVESLRDSARTPLALLLTLTGVAFFALILRLALQFKQFLRRPEDHAHILGVLLRQGRFGVARRRLDKLDQHTRNDSSLVVPRIQLLVAEGDFDKAYALYEHHFGIRDDSLTGPHPARTTDDLLAHMLTASRLIELTPEQYGGLVSWTIERGASDGLLSLFLPEMLSDLDAGSPEDLEQLGIDHDRHPITLAVLTWMASDDPDEDDMQARLVAELVPDLLTDELAQQHARVRFLFFRNANVATPVRQMLDLLEHSSDLPNWASGEYSLFLLQTGHAARLDTELLVRIERYRNALVAGLDEDEAAVQRALTDAARKLAERS